LFEHSKSHLETPPENDRIPSTNRRPTRSTFLDTGPISIVKKLPVNAMTTNCSQLTPVPPVDWLIDAFDRVKQNLQAHEQTRDQIT